MKLYDNLELLEIIVLEVTDEALQIIEFLLRPDSEKPPAKSADPWSPITREYPDVLWQLFENFWSIHALDTQMFDDGFRAGPQNLLL